MHPASVCPEPGSNSPNKKPVVSPCGCSTGKGSRRWSVDSGVPVTLQLIRQRHRLDRLRSIRGLLGRNPGGHAARHVVVVHGPPTGGRPARLVILGSRLQTVNQRRLAQVRRRRWPAEVHGRLAAHGRPRRRAAASRAPPPRARRRPTSRTARRSRLRRTCSSWAD